MEIEYRELIEKIQEWKEKCLSFLLVCDMLVDGEKMDCDDLYIQLNRFFDQILDALIRAENSEKEIEWKNFAIEAAGRCLAEAEKQIEYCREKCEKSGGICQVEMGRRKAAEQKSKELEARAKSAEERAENAEKKLENLKSILGRPRLFEKNGVIYPIKSTSRKDVYKAMVEAKKAAELYDMPPMGGLHD